MGKFILVVLVFAAAVYGVMLMLEKRRAARMGAARAAERPQRRPGPSPRRAVAPDDDPDFLRDLDRRRKNDDPPVG